MNESLKDGVNELGNQLHGLKNNANDNLAKENDRLKEEVNKFSIISCKLNKGKENVDIILGCQRQSFSKHGLGYNPFLSRKGQRKCFSNNETQLIMHAHVFGDSGHVAFMYNLRFSKNVCEKKI